MRRLGTLALVAMTAVATITTAGCTRNRAASRANYDLRLEREVLTNRVAELEAQIAELEAKLEASETDAISAVALSELPIATSIAITSTSGFRRDGSLAVLLTAADGRGRAVQPTGSLAVEVLHRSAEGEEAMVLTQTTLDAAQLRDAYRSGLTGPRYEVRFTPDAVVGADSIVVIARLTDAVTGQTLEASDAFTRPGVREARASAGDS